MTAGSSICLALSPFNKSPYSLLLLGSGAVCSHGNTQAEMISQGSCVGALAKIISLCNNPPALPPRSTGLLLLPTDVWQKGYMDKDQKAYNNLGTKRP